VNYIGNWGLKKRGGRIKETRQNPGRRSPRKRSLHLAKKFRCRTNYNTTRKKLTEEAFIEESKGRLFNKKGVGRVVKDSIKARLWK